MRSLARAALAFLLALPVVLIAAPAHAVTTNIWLSGTRSAIVVGDAGSFLGDITRTSCIYRAYAVVVYSNDRVYIRDDCNDGIPATAWVQWKNSSGNGLNYYCVNNFGQGTYAMCDLDWPEGGSTVKMLVAGLRYPSTTPGQWQWGNYVNFRD